MRKLSTSTVFVLASIAFVPLGACTDTVQEEEIETSPEPYVPEREDGPTDLSE